MTLEEVIGQNIARARGKEMTQDDLAALTGTYLRQGWTRQGVWLAEKGRRDFRAGELAALSIIFRKPVGWFFIPRGDDPIRLEGGGDPIDQHGATFMFEASGKEASYRAAVRKALDVLSAADSYGPSASSPRKQPKGKGKK